MKRSGIISLLTDFGTRDGYVAAIKAVILEINPLAHLIDMSHDIEPQDVRAGAFLLSAHCKFFPAGSVHLAVIDPGVGTDRRLVALQAGDQIYVGPDNGLLDFCIELGIKQAVEITNQALWHQPVSMTFHGRDILAPVASHLSLGKPFQEIGTHIGIERRLPVVSCKVSREEIFGQVVYVDRFGNLITNISSRMLRELGGGEHLEVSLDGKNAGTLRSTYASVPAGSTVAVVGGFDRLEIALNGGDACSAFGAGVGASVAVQKKS